MNCNRLEAKIKNDKEAHSKLLDSEQCFMDADLDDWTALDEHVSEDGFELTKQLAVFNTCSNQLEKDEEYKKDKLEAGSKDLIHDDCNDSQIPSLDSKAEDKDLILDDCNDSQIPNLDSKARNKDLIHDDCNDPQIPSLDSKAEDKDLILDDCNDSQIPSLDSKGNMKNFDPKNTNLQFDQYDESKEGNDQTEQTEVRQLDCNQSEGGTKMSNQERDLSGHLTVKLLRESYQNLAPLNDTIKGWIRWFLAKLDDYIRPVSRKGANENRDFQIQSALCEEKNNPSVKDVAAETCRHTLDSHTLEAAIIKKLEKRIADLENKSSLYDSRFEEDNHFKQKLENRISQHDSWFEENDHFKQNVETKMGQHDSQLEENDHFKQNLQRKIARHDSHFEENDLFIQNVETAMAQHDFKLQENDRFNQTLQTKIAQHDSQFEENDDFKQTLQTKIAQHDSQFEENDDFKQTLETKIAQHDSQFEENDDFKQTLQTKIAQYDSRFVENDQILRQHFAVWRNHQDRISELEQFSQSFNTMLSNLTAKINSLFVAFGPASVPGHP